MSKAQVLRRDEIQRVSGELMAHLEESGLSPIEGFTAVEALYSLLLLRGMDAAAKTTGSNEQLENEARQLALRSLARMQSRVLAWPARVEDRS